MAIRKREFYEGAALHQLICGGAINTLRQEPPFFIINDETLLYLKYCTRGRSPWGFTFSAEEQTLLELRGKQRRLIMGLICGPDGIVAVPYSDYCTIASRRGCSVHVSCARRHGHHYAVAGPDGDLDSKVPPSQWTRIL